MKDFLIGIGVIALTFATLTGAVAGLFYANSQWNCSSWHEATGDQTRVVAGECMVHNPRTGRWEIYDSYIRDHHVGLHDDEEGSR